MLILVLGLVYEWSKGALIGSKVMGLEEKLPERHHHDAVETLVNWACGEQHVAALFARLRCAIEMIATGSSRRHLAPLARNSSAPARARLIWMIVSGRVSKQDGACHQAPLRPDVRAEMGHRHGHFAPAPADPFNNYAIVQGVDKIIPVDVYVPGARRPEGLLYAMDKLRAKQGKDNFRNTPIERPPAPATPEDIESLETLRQPQPA